LLLPVVSDFDFLQQWTQPFYRVLNITNPPMSGSDVVIAQNLLQRSPSSNWNVSKNGIYSVDTAKAVGLFQKSHKMQANHGTSCVLTVVFDHRPVNGVLDMATSNALLAACLDDGYKDNGELPAGYLYKVVLPVEFVADKTSRCTFPFIRIAPSRPTRRSTIASTTPSSPSQFGMLFLRLLQHG
jgi:hypothetical protein